MSLIQIQRQYERIPTFQCKTGCTECCGNVPFTKEEWDQLTPEEQARPTQGLTCRFKGDSGCTIYDRRPMLCRLFGAVDDPKLTCWHGCRPAQPLTKIQGATIMRHYLKLQRIYDPLTDDEFLSRLAKIYQHETTRS